MGRSQIRDATTRRLRREKDELTSLKTGRNPFERAVSK